MMTTHDKVQKNKTKKIKKKTIESGIEYRATIRFPRKDYEFMQELIENGEYTNITEIVRDAVKKFRLEWVDHEASSRFMPMAPWMMDRKMPMMMRKMMKAMQEQQEENEE
jgi:Arc/MetJ-type ribon-helix-helix transcriptional regulator